MLAHPDRITAVPALVVEPFAFYLSCYLLLPVLPLYPWSRTVGAVLARSSFAVIFLTAAAATLTGAALAMSRWKPRPD